MSTDRETTRLVRSWLDQGVTALPDRVLDAVLDQVPATPQRRSWWPARRFSHMNNPVRFAIAVAAVLVIVLIGYQFLPSNSGVGGKPSPAPTATQAAVVPTASPGASGAPRLPGDQANVPAGTYTLDPVLGLRLDVPAGWGSCCAGGVVTKGDFAAFYYEVVTGSFVPADACHWQTGTRSTPLGAQAFAAALSAQVPRDGSQPRAVTVAGLPAFHVRLTVPANQPVASNPAQDFAGCDGAEGRFISYGSASGEPMRYHQSPSQIDDMYIVDIGNATVVFDLISAPQIAAADKSALEAMLASIKID